MFDTFPIHNGIKTRLVIPIPVVTLFYNTQSENQEELQVQGNSKKKVTLSHVYNESNQ
jgi:hypothetical protein